MGHEKKTSEPLKKGDEQDALTGWRKLIRFKPRQRKAAKNSFNRRVRYQRIEIDEPD